MKVTGYRESSGVYNNISYNNIILECQVEMGTKGYRTKSYKIKKKILDDWMSAVGISDYEYLIGMDLNFYFNEWQQIVLIQELGNSSKK